MTNIEMVSRSMVILVRRNTLWSSVKEVVATPFIFVYANVFIYFLLPLIWLLRPVIARLPNRVVSWLSMAAGILMPMAAIAIVASIAFGLGVDREQLNFFVFFAVLLWIVATGLSLFDHFRYRGWMVESNDVKEAFVEAFASLLVAAESRESLQRMTPRYRASCESKLHERSVTGISSQVGRAARPVPFNQPSMFPLQILPKLLPFLEACEFPEASIVAFVLLESDESLERSWLRMTISTEGDEPLIDSFELVGVFV